VRESPRRKQTYDQTVPLNRQCDRTIPCNTVTMTATQSDYLDRPRVAPVDDRLADTWLDQMRTEYGSLGRPENRLDDSYLRRLQRDRHVRPPSAITAPSSFPAASGLGRNVLSRELGALIRGSLLPADFSSGWALPERQITPRRNLPRVPRGHRDAGPTGTTFTRCWWWRRPGTGRPPPYGCWQGCGPTMAATWWGLSGSIGGGRRSASRPHRRPAGRSLASHRPHPFLPLLPPN
jgi:hypothetical protein